MVILVDSLLLRGDSLIIDVSVFLIDTFKIYLLNLKKIIDPLSFPTCTMENVQLFWIYYVTMSLRV